jgi:hypothetical protein
MLMGCGLWVGCVCASRASRAAANKYGSVPQLAENEFVAEVSKASADTVVVVLLFVHSKPECQLLQSLIGRVAGKFRAVKFVKMLAGQCIRNYPDAKTPTIIVYKNGNVVHTEVGLNAYGGLKATPESQSPPSTPHSAELSRAQPHSRRLRCSRIQAVRCGLIADGPL